MCKKKSAQILNELLKKRIGQLHRDADESSNLLKAAISELKVELRDEPEFDSKDISAETLHEIANEFGISFKELFDFPLLESDNDS